MIKDIKKRMLKLKNKKIKILVDVGRNKSEEYEGYIKNMYDNVWTFQTSFELMSFSYKDILIKQIIIKDN